MTGSRRARDTYARHRSATVRGAGSESIGVREEKAGDEEAEPLLLRLWVFIVRCVLTAAVWIVATVVWLTAFGLWGLAGSLLGWLLIPPVMGWLDGRGNAWQDAVLATLSLWPAFFVYTLTLTLALDADMLWLLAVATAAVVVHHSLRIRYE